MDQRQLRRIFYKRMDDNNKPTVVFFYRKPRASGNFSIEFLFDHIREGLSPAFNSRKVISHYFSNGFFKRLFNVVSASRQQGDINHVIGDVHFLTLMMKRRKTVLTIHDCVFMNHPSSMARFIFRWFWLRLPIRQSAVVTVVSQVTKDEVLRHVSCDPRKIRVIPNFVSGRFSFSPAEFNQSLPTILHIGTAPNKNLERLIAAIEGLSCRLLIVGKLTPLHRDLLKQHRVDFENVFNIDEEELVRVYQRCDMLSFVSTYEGFGMPILEAQITGRPVITSNLSSMPSVAGEGALLVNPYEEKDIRQGIVKIINDAHFRNQLIGKGKDNARRFSLKETIGQYEHIYRELLQDLEK